MTIKSFKNHETIKIKIDKNDINFIKTIIKIRVQINEKKLIEHQLMICIEQSRRCDVEFSILQCLIRRRCIFYQNLYRDQYKKSIEIKIKNA
jgi:hypothetical protein